jgi:hypothetical protein
LAKTFTLEEARTLLPVLGALLRRTREAAVRASEFEGQMQELSQRIFLSGGMHVDVGAAARRRAERDKAVQQARSTIEEIEQIGARIGDMEEGRIEFPHLLEGREVLLCWTLGEEEEIRHWRESEDDSPLRSISDGGFRNERDRPN